MAVVRSGVHHYIYINGVLDGAATSTSVIDNQSGSDPSKPFRIGARGTTSPQDHFNGHVTMCASGAWLATRGDPAIEETYELAAEHRGRALVSYYKFDQATRAATTRAWRRRLFRRRLEQLTLNNFALTGSTSNWITPGGVVSGTSCPALVFPELDLSGNSNPIADGDSSPSVADGTDFGSVNTSSTLDHDFTMTNNGIGDLHISGITAIERLYRSALPRHSR